MVEKKQKTDMLSKLISEGNWKQVLVFTRTKHGANKLCQKLVKAGITAAAIHGNKSQGARTKALADFKKGSVRVLVATDIAARGLDIPLLPYVVNFELPNIPEDYIHRIGRTGRAGASGIAVSLVDAEERGYLRDIEKLSRQSIPLATLEGFENVVSNNNERSAASGRSPEQVRSTRNPRQKAKPGKRSWFKVKEQRGGRNSFSKE